MFNMSKDVHVRRDQNNRVVQLQHLDQPFRASHAAPEMAMVEGAGPTARQLADAYVRDVMPIYDMAAGVAANLTGNYSPPQAHRCQRQFLQEIGNCRPVRLDAGGGRRILVGCGRSRRRSEQS